MNQLSLRDRLLVTVTALPAQGLTDSSFRYHLENANEWLEPVDEAEYISAIC